MWHTRVTLCAAECACLRDSTGSRTIGAYTRSRDGWATGGSAENVPVSNRRGRCLVIATASAVLTALACHDDIVGPMERSPHALGDSRNQTFGEFDLNIPPDNSYPTYGALALETTSITLPPNKWVVLTVTDGVRLAISSVCNGYPDCPGTATHAGQTIDALGIYPSSLQVHLSGAGYSNIPLSYDDHYVPTALVWSGSGGVISASRGGIQDGVSCYSPWRDPNTGLTGCGVDIFFFANAYTMTGTQTLKAALVDPIVVHGSPTTIHPGDSVTFTATLAGSTYQNGNVWTWVAGEVGNQQQDELTNDPPSGGVRVGCNLSPCVYAPTQSGRMYVQSTDYYGHPMLGSSEYIAINSGQLHLVATPNVLGPPVLASRTQNFQQTAAPYAPSTKPAASEKTASRAESPKQKSLGTNALVQHDETESGTAVTFLASTYDSSSITVQSWSYQPDSAALGSSTPCTASDNPCVYNVEQSGTMFVTALVGGKQELASAHVMFPCPTVGDSVLDAPGIVDDLKAALAASNPNAVPGTGVKKEHLGAIFRWADGSYFTIPYDDPTATECASDASVIDTVPPSGATFVAIYHTHPSGWHQPTYGCDPNKIYPYAQYKGQPNAVVPYAVPDSLGGGSPADWAYTNAHHLEQYTINKDGHIWHLKPGMDPLTSKLKYTWKKNSSCATH
jgi:hypothetical protein